MDILKFETAYAALRVEESIPELKCFHNISLILK